MQEITPTLWISDDMEDAAEFYCSLFEDSRVTGSNDYGPDAGEYAGKGGKLVQQHPQHNERGILIGMAAHRAGLNSDWAEPGRQRHQQERTAKMRRREMRDERHERACECASQENDCFASTPRYARQLDDTRQVYRERDKHEARKCSRHRCRSDKEI